MVAVSSTMNSGLQAHVYICTPMPGGLFDHLRFSVTFNYVGIPTRRSFKELFAITVAVLIWSTFYNPARLFFIVTISLLFIFLNQYAS